MATRTRNISLPEELDAAIQRRVRSGHYGNISDVIRASLRVLNREDMGERGRRLDSIMAKLPQQPITPALEQDIVRRVKQSRERERKAKTRDK